MKRKISITFIAISALVLLIYAILPHHHHEDLACIIIEFCEQDNAVNDEHTHHDDAPDEQQHKSCIVESGFIMSYFTNDAKCKIPSCKDHDHNHVYLFPLYFLAADFFKIEADDLATLTGYGERASYYKSAEANQFHGLRAPPFV